MKTVLIFAGILVLIILGSFAYSKNLSPAISTPTPTVNGDTNLSQQILNLLVEKNPDFTGANITVNKIEGDYAKGMVNTTGGGGIWFAAKVNNSWKLVWDGNGIIQCGELVNYPNFPSDLIPQCFDTSTNSLVNR